MVSLDTGAGEEWALSLLEVRAVVFCALFH